MNLTSKPRGSLGVLLYISSMNKPTKYLYEMVIQQNWGYGHGWEDVDAYDCDSTGFIRDREQRELYKYNYRAYRTEGGAPCRSITRKTLREVAA
jgi:hypothetical protein